MHPRQPRSSRRCSPSCTACAISEAISPSLIRVRFSPPPGWVDARGLHGTTTGYGYGCRCDECRAANTEAMRAANARRRAALAVTAPTLKHGTKGAYSNHGCRCEACVEAVREANRKRPSRARG